MVMFTFPLLSVTLFDGVPFASSIKCLSGLNVLSNLINLDSSVMCAVAPQVNSTVLGFSEFASLA